MAELGGAFLVALLVLGEMGEDGNMVMAGVLLAVTMAAMAGGFTRVCVMPNTDPPLDTPEAMNFIQERST